MSRVTIRTLDGRIIALYIVHRISVFFITSTESDPPGKKLDEMTVGYETYRKYQLEGVINLKMTVNWQSFVIDGIEFEGVPLKFAGYTMVYCHELESHLLTHPQIGETIVVEIQSH